MRQADVEAATRDAPAQPLEPGRVMPQLTHFDAGGAARMVDVVGQAGDRAAARSPRGWVAMAPETLALVAAGGAKKGDVLGVARLAGIMAAKRTADLIPLCHPLPLASVALELTPDAAPRRRRASRRRSRTTGQTGVEMEALTAVSVAALTVYDMLKAVDRGMVIGDIRLLAQGGRQVRALARRRDRR